MAHQATLSSSWTPAASSASPTPSPLDQTRSFIGRLSSPSPHPGESATTIAWRNALNSYRKSLSDKDFKRITIPAGPDDVANEVEKWQCKHSTSKYARVAAAVRAGVGRMQRFSASIDMLAQGSPSPGCLLWGSIKFVLTILQDAAEEYDKLCQALSRMVDCLPRIELYTETFLDSELVRACVSAFYLSSLRFWTRACKFYRRHRLLNFIRVVWNDFGAEFGELESSMIENRDRVERTALAEHIGQSKVARVYQQSVNHKLLEVQQSARQKEITAWLAPAVNDVHYYQNDLDNARALRHPKTCQWIFEKEETGLLFGGDRDSPGNGMHEKSFLWIHAKPGAGKTILSSCLIDNAILEDDSRLKKQHVIYFFCKSLDADKNNATAVLRSLLFQLYKLTQEQGTQTLLTANIEKAMDESGKRQAVDFTPIWTIFADHVKSISATLIVLDALDECQDAEQLLLAMKSLVPSKLIKIIVTSRKEAHLFTQLRSSLSLEITAEDIHSDIVAYVEAKVLGSPRLSHPLIRDMVITRLSTGHSGMFLWVYLILKELKSCFSVAQVQGVLANLPKGLDGIYKSILQRLRDNLPTASLDLCYKVLTWVVSAIRPLKVEELGHALSLHHEIEGDTLLFEYADKDIELVCGSLVTVRQGTLQVIHLTVKEFLTSTHGPTYSTYSDLLVNPAKASSQLTLVCLKCIKDSLNESMLDLAPGTARLDMKLDDEAVMQRQRQAPLAEYASLTWMMHLTECDGVHMLGVSKAFQAAFESPSTFGWVEACMTFQPDSVLHLLVGLEEAIEYVSGLSPDHWSEREPSCVFFTDWCHTLRNIFEEYGSIVSHRPFEVHFLDLRSSFSRIEQVYEKYGNTLRRDITRYIDGYDSPRSCRPGPLAVERLQQDVLRGLPLETDIFFIHDERRRLYFWGHDRTDLNNVRLFVQNAMTGQRLPPSVRLDDEASREGYLDSYGLSPGGEYIVVVYQTKAKSVDFWEGRKLTLVWQISEELRFTKRLRSEPWARISFSHQSQNGLFRAPDKCVVFLDDGYCLTPSGKIHLASSSRRPLFDGLLKDFYPADMNFYGSFYSRNGKYLFISEMLRGIYWAKRVALSMETSEYICSWKESSRRLVNVSPSGRFLVLSSDGDMIRTGRGDENLYLYDVSTSETVLLPFVERSDYDEIKYHFMKNESELIVFIGRWIHGVYMMNVLVWSDLQSEPVLRSHGQLNVGFISPHQIHVNDDESSALMVSEDMVIRRVDFRTQVTFPDSFDLNDDYPCTISKVSKDGARWALLRYGQNKAQLQMTDVSAARGPIYRLDLELPLCDEPYLLAVSFSPDLRVLVVDAQVFSIVEGINGLTATSFTIQGLPELLLDYRTRLNFRDRYRLRCVISPCNSYFIFISPGDPNAREAAPSTLYAFRVDLVSRSSVRLNLHLPKDLTFISADFHPSQQLMLLTYSLFSRSDSQPLEEVPPPQVSIVELGSLEMKPIALPKNRPFVTRITDISNYGLRPPRLEFSDCGTFILMELKHNWKISPDIYIIHEIDAGPVTTRYYSLEHQGYTQKHATPSGEYVIETEEVDGTSSQLVSRKLLKADLCEENSHVTSQHQDDQRVYLNNVVCYSSRLADSDRFLLLGKNDDEKMRLLIAPREGQALEITTLSLSFNEAKRRLEAEWEKRQALRDKETGRTREQSAVLEEDSSEEDSSEDCSEDGSKVDRSEEDRCEENRREKNDNRGERANSPSH